MGTVFLTASSVIDDDEWFYHGAFCIIGLLITGLALAEYRKKSLTAFLSEPRILSAVVFSIYFFIGALQLVLDSEEQIAQMMAQWPMTAKSVLKIDSVNTIGMGFALIVSVAIRPLWLPSIVRKVGNSVSGVGYGRLILTFLVLGGIAKVRIILNDYSGDPVVISGLWRNASLILNAVILLGMLYKGRGSTAVYVVVSFVAFFLSFIGILGFNKTAFVSPLLLLALGFGIRKNSLVISISAVILAFALADWVGDSVEYARSNKLSDSSFNGRLGHLMEGLRQTRSIHYGDGYKVWSRLNYVPAQAAALDFYDQDRGGDDFGLILWAFVPRFLYPDKPVMTSTGTEFYYKITGHYGSSTGMGLFANGYYNKGWLGVFVSALFFGFLLAQSAAVSRLVVEKSYIVLFPFVFLSFNLATGSIGILVEIIGQFVILGALIICLWFITDIFGLGTRTVKRVQNGR